MPESIPLTYRPQPRWAPIVRPLLLLSVFVMLAVFFGWLAVGALVVDRSGGEIVSVPRLPAGRHDHAIDPTSDAMAFIAAVVYAGLGGLFAIVAIRQVIRIRQIRRETLPHAVLSATPPPPLPAFLSTKR